MAIKTPDATAFIQSNFSPLNEYIGKAEVNIPIYKIDFKGLEIPISISYNTGGVPVNSLASCVGLNWTLQAGGVIAKETAGAPDNYLSGYYHDEEGKYIYTSYGWLCDLFGIHATHNGYPVEQVIPNALRDLQPDRYYAAAPGLQTAFIHKSNGKPMEITNTFTKIESPYDAPPPINQDGQIYFNLTTSKGFKYVFDKAETYYVLPESRREFDSNHPLTDNLVDDLWPVSMDVYELNQRIYSLSTGEWRWRNFSHEWFSVIHLSSIKEVTSNQTVDFVYEENNLVDNNRRIERTTTVDDNSVIERSQVNYEHDFHLEQVLQKIVFPEGSINFYYDNNRLDIRGGKSLKSIEVKNNRGDLVKRILFNYIYTGTQNPADPQTYRLHLASVDFSDNSNNILPGFKFEYNGTVLPKRYSTNQDFTGYFNGSNGIPETNYVPKIYKNPNQGKRTFLPFPLPEEGYQPYVGNGSLEAALNYAKAETLETIKYPTGGYTKFDYDLNSFTFLGHEIKGGGIRVLSESLYDRDNNLANRISYDYSENNLTGLTSGSINNLANYISYVPSGTLGVNTRYYINQVPSNRLQVTNNSFVGYGKCKVQELNNGYKIDTYTDIKAYPNIYPNSYEHPVDPWAFGGDDMTDLNNQLQSGFAPTIYQDFDVKRGRLVTSDYYNNQGQKLKSIINEYSYFQYDTNDEKEAIKYGIEPYIKYRYRTKGYVLYTSPIRSANYLQTGSWVSEKSQFDDSYINSYTAFIYDDSRPLLRSKDVSINNSNIIKERYFYPFDGEVATLPNIGQLNAMNKIIPIKLIKLKNNTPLFTSLTSYGSFSGGRIFPTKVSEAPGGNQLEEKKLFKNYDINGNLLEEQKPNDLSTSYLWGYDKTYPVAKVAGADYATISGYINQVVLDSPSSDVALRTELANLRNGLASSGSKALVTTYTYKPLVGVTSQTDANGKTIYYEYDAFGRLSIVRDKDNNVLKKYCYDYQGQSEACSISTGPSWEATGQVRCKPCPAIGAYTSNLQEREEKDNNPNSPSFNSLRWVDNGISSSCVPQAVWHVATVECDGDANHQNTGYQITTYRDVNPCSPTYNQTSQTSTYNPSACPLPAACSSSNCAGPDHSCINGFCETGRMIYISSVKINKTTWQCTYQYCYSDGSQSSQYTQYSSSSCLVTGGCVIK